MISRVLFFSQLQEMSGLVQRPHLFSRDSIMDGDSASVEITISWKIGFGGQTSSRIIQQIVRILLKNRVDARITPGTSTWQNEQEDCAIVLLTDARYAEPSQRGMMLRRVWRPLCHALHFPKCAFIRVTGVYSGCMWGWIWPGARCPAKPNPSSDEIAHEGRALFLLATNHTMHPPPPPPLRRQFATSL